MSHGTISLKHKLSIIIQPVALGSESARNNLDLFYDFDNLYPDGLELGNFFLDEFSPELMFDGMWELHNFMFF